MSVEPTQRTLTDLPFEVLDQIFKGLAGYNYSKDKLDLAETNEYLGHAFAYHSRDAYKKCDNLFVPDTDWPLILSLCGSTIEEYIALPGRSAEVTKAVAQYCPNLKIVYFNDSFDNDDLVLSVINKARSTIENLNYINNKPDPAKIMHKLPELPQLKILKIYPFFVDEAYEIQRFANIEELYLSPPESDGKDPKPLNLFKVCSHLKKLRRLRVLRVHIISETDEGEEEIPEFPALEHFELGSSIISMEFPSCPKLKILDISDCKCNIEDMICRSVLKQGQDLKKLSVESRPYQFDNESLLKVIRKFGKLRSFNVPIRKIKFDLGFVIELVNALRENGITEEDPLALDFDEINKIPWLRFWLSYISASNLIEILV